MGSIKEIMKAINLGFINPDIWNSIDINVKRMFIKHIITQILWDGEKIDIILFDDLFPQCNNSK